MPLVQNGADRAELPPYVYPEDPPVADRAALRRLIDQLNVNSTIIWVMGDSISPEMEAPAQALSAQRDPLRAVGCRPIALFTGAAQEWDTSVLPLLRGVRANFICAVVAPFSSQAIARWLAGKPEAVAPGVYLLNRNQEVVSVLPAEVEAINKVATDLAENRIALDAPLRARDQVMQARFRLIELPAGRTRANAEVEAEEAKGLADEIAQQLAGSYKPQGLVAVLPIRCLQAPAAGAPDVVATVGERLAHRLEGLGWSRIIGPEEAARSMAAAGLTPINVEFEPATASARLGWTAVVAGYLVPDSASGYTSRR